MKKNQKRSFKVLKESMTSMEFNYFCQDIAEKYANSDGQCAKSYFSDKYDLSHSCFYKILEYAIVENLVSDEVVNLMQVKAIKNQKVHAENAGSRSILHYQDMRRKRYEKIVSNLSEKEIEEIAKEFAINFQISKKELAEKHGMTIRVIDMILVRAILELIVDDKTFALIRERSLINGNNIKKTEAFFNELTRIRNRNMQDALQ